MKSVPRSAPAPLSAISDTPGLEQDTMSGAQHTLSTNTWASGVERRTVGGSTTAADGFGTSDLVPQQLGPVGTGPGHTRDFLADSADVGAVKMDINGCERRSAGCDPTAPPFYPAVPLDPDVIGHAFYSCRGVGKCL